MSTETTRWLLIALAAGMVTCGAGLIFAPASLIVGGLCLAAVAVLLTD